MTTEPDRTAKTMEDQGRALRSLAGSILRGTDGADDVVQEAYAAALQREPEDGARPGWLAAVVRNLARRLLRDRGRRRSHETAAAETGSAPAADDVVAEVEMHRDLADAVLELTEPYRTAVVLRFWHDLPPRAIARRLGVPVATVKTHLQRGLAMLRARLDRRYGDRRAWLLALVPLARPGALAALTAGTAASIPTLVLTMNTKHLLAGAAAVLLCTSLAIWSLSGLSDSDPPLREGAPGAPAITAEIGGPAAAPAVDVEAEAGEVSTAGNAVARTEVSDERPPCVVTGRIVADANGAPIEGATLRLTRLAPFADYPDRSAVTDEQGRFRLEARWWGKGDWIGYTFALASAPGLATRELDLDHEVQERIADGALDLGTFRLVRGVGVTGRVQEQDGRALSGRARLIVWDPTRRGSYVSMYQGRTLGWTDDAGGFVLDERLTPPEGGELMLAAVADWGMGWVRLGVAPGQEHLDPLEIRLQPSGGVSVRVVDSEGRPVGEATVCATPHFLPIGLEPMWQETSAPNSPPPLPELLALFLRETDDDGRAVLPHLPLSTGQAHRDDNRMQRPVPGYIVKARADGFVPNVATVKPAPGGLAELEIVLRQERTVVVQGRVTTPGGDAVAGVEVRGNGRNVAAVTDEDGHYALEPFAYGSAAHFITEGPDFPRVFSRVEIPEEGDTVEHDIVVEKRSPVNGRVVDQHGAPVAGVRLLIGVEGGTHYDSTPERTGADGRFAFPDATPSQDDLWITPPEPRTAWEPVRNRKLSRRVDEEIVLRRFDGDLVDLRVTVVDGETGLPVSPGEVTLHAVHGESRAWNAAHLQPELSLGRVTADDIRPGRYRLIVRATDERRGESVIDVGDAPVTETRLELWRSASVTCTLDTSALTDADRASTRGMIVVLHPRHEQAYGIDEQGEPMSWTENTGIFRLGRSETFTLARVTPNTPLCLRTIGGELFGETWFTAEPGRETRVTLRPERPGTLAFRVPADLPAGAIEIDVADASGERRPARHMGRAAGQSETIDLRRVPGEVRWRLRFWAEGGQEPVVRTGTAEVRAGATSVVPWSAK